MIVHGDCLDAMAGMADASVHAIVTDPPYGLGFMGRAWDDLPPGIEWARECWRVLKPGGHLVAFGGTRTAHRLVVAVEDAGLEIRDTLAWLHGAGFPKSLDVSKAIDREAGAEREPLGPARRGAQTVSTGRYGAWGEGIVPTAPATADAERWHGWGTALKPAHEPIVLARRPVAGTVADNVVANGAGGLNVAGSMIGERWPANVLLDSEAAAMLDVQSGAVVGYPDTAASRFFYVSKASAGERDAGVDGGNRHPTVKPVDLMRWLVRLVTPPGGLVLDPFAGSGTTGIAAYLEGVTFIGVEREADYVEIAHARLDWWARRSAGHDTAAVLGAIRADDAMIPGQLAFPS